MIMNALPFQCVPKDHQGGHAWSRDAITWSEPRVGAFNTSISFSDGTVAVCERRERPKIIKDPISGDPIALVTGVLGCPPGIFKGYRGGDDSFTLVQEITQPPYRNRGSASAGALIRNRRRARRERRHHPASFFS